MGNIRSPVQMTGVQFVEHRSGFFPGLSAVSCSVNICGFGLKTHIFYKVNGDMDSPITNHNLVKVTTDYAVPKPGEQQDSFFSLL